MQALISEHSTQPEAASADHTAADDGLANTDGNMDGAPFKAVISTGRLKANETVPMSTLRAVLIEGQDTADSYTVNDSSTTPEHGDDVDLGGDLESEEVVGSRREVRRLFLQKPRQYGVEDVWSSIPPGNKTPDEAQRTANRTRIHNKTFAIVHHYETSLETISLVVQSAELKEAIRPVFDGYPGIDLNSPEPKFFPLFIPFLHRWDRLVKVVNDELNKSTESLLGLPKDTLDHDMEPLFRSKREYQQSGYIEYKYLGIPFVPVMVVVHRDKDDILSAGILKSQNNGTLTVSVLDWDGSVFGYDDVSWGFTHFDGFRKLTDLSYFPLTTHPDGQCIRRDLVERGKRFEELSARHLKQYSGVMMSYDKLSWREKSPVSLSERIVIDAKAYYKFSGDYDNKLQGLEDCPSIDKGVAGSETGGRQQLTDDQRLLALPTARGIALESKKWGLFRVSNISAIHWNKDAFRNLVADENEKELLLALVSQHAQQAGSGLEDFVKGKGEGLLLLLGGPPGVGKTLTAESVAEELKRPLYRLRAGDLGLKPAGVESSLKNALDLCQYLDAVLLIDEADVFLERRTSSDLQRNELVSIFLVLLEYYKGILILTSNRSDSLDRAFESRIDIVLNYDGLGPTARRQVWSNFLKKIPSHAIRVDEEDLDVLAAWDVNGRQIKSAVKTGRILAAHRREPLNLGHLELVLNVRKKGSELLSYPV